MRQVRTNSHIPKAGFLLAALLALSLALASGAQASKKQPTIFDSTAGLLSAPNQASRDQILNQMDALGADMVRIVVPWRFLAPNFADSVPPAGFNATNPREYSDAQFAGLDASVAGITERGMKVLLTPSSPVPSWATKSGKSLLVDPKPAAYKDFVTALGRRYGGSYRVDQGKTCPPNSLPSTIPIPPELAPYLETCDPRAPSAPLPNVTNWAIWNEPDQTLFLQPQFKKGKPYSPTLYRRLFLAGQAGLAAAGKPNDTLLIGETAPSGGRDGVDPIEFMRGVFCLDANFRPKGKCAPINATAWAHHPYSPGVAPFRASDNPGLINVQTIGKLVSALGKAGAAKATTRKLKIWVTEFGVQSKPDPKFGVSFMNQAGYLAIAEYKLWKLGAVKTFSQYLLRDDSLKQKSPFTTGLRLFSGAPKLSYKAFPMTLLAQRKGSRVLIWGHVRPGQGRRSVTVEVKDPGGKAKTLKTVRTNPAGYFTFGSAFVQGRTWAAQTQIDGRKLQGPFLPAYAF